MQAAHRGSGSVQAPPRHGPAIQTKLKGDIACLTADRIAVGPAGSTRATKAIIIVAFPQDAPPLQERRLQATIAGVCLDPRKVGQQLPTNSRATFRGDSERNLIAIGYLVVTDRHCGIELHSSSHAHGTLGCCQFALWFNRLRFELIGLDGRGLPSLLLRRSSVLVQGICRQRMRLTKSTPSCWAITPSRSIPCAESHRQIRGFFTTDLGAIHGAVGLWST